MLKECHIQLMQIHSFTIIIATTSINNCRFIPVSYTKL